MRRISTLECRQCGHKWLPRRPQKTITCPACKSQQCDKPLKKEENRTE